MSNAKRIVINRKMADDKRVSTLSNHLIGSPRVYERYAFRSNWRFTSYWMHVNRRDKRIEKVVEDYTKFKIFFYAVTFWFWTIGAAILVVFDAHLESVCKENALKCSHVLCIDISASFTMSLNNVGTNARDTLRIKGV